MSPVLAAAIRAEFMGCAHPTLCLIKDRFTSGRARHWTGLLIALTWHDHSRHVTVSDKQAHAPQEILSWDDFQACVQRLT